MKLFEIIEEDDRRYAIFPGTNYHALKKRSIVRCEQNEPYREYFRVPNLISSGEYGSLFSFIRRGADALCSVKIGLGDESLSSPEVSCGNNEIIMYLDRDYGRDRAASYLSQNNDVVFRYFIKFGHEYYDVSGRDLGQEHPTNPADGWKSEGAAQYALHSLRDFGRLYEGSYLDHEVIRIAGNEPTWRQYLTYVQVPFKVQL